MKSLAYGMLTFTLVSIAFAAEQRRGEIYRIVERLAMGDVPHDLANKCGLPVIGYAMQHRNELEKRGISFSTLFDRPVMQKSILRGNFRIHYDTTGIDEPALLNAQHVRIPGTAHSFADSVAAIANYCLRFEVDSLGFLPPPSDGGEGGGTETDIYIQELGDMYGETVPETRINNKPDGATHTNFIRVDNDFIFVSPDYNKGLPGLRVTLAHELHHAVQIGRYGYWAGDRFFYEISSVWMEDVTFTDVNDYVQYVRSSSGHFRHPEVSFASNDFIMYSRGIWGHFVAKKYGRVALRRCWEEIRNVRPLLATDAALQQTSGVSFRTAFVEWTTWNLFTADRSDSLLYYSEGRLYPSITKVPVDLNTSPRSFTGTLQPFSTRYHEIDQRVTLPVSNLDLNAALNSSATQFSYTLQLSTTKPDNSYVMAGTTIYVRLNVSDPQNWFMPGASGSNAPFPNPLRADGIATINFPVNATASGTLSVFSSSMDLVYFASAFPKYINGQNVIQWNGRNDANEVAASGVYIYVIEAAGEKIIGKFALLRK